MKICIKNGLVINPATNLEQVTNIFIEDGHVVFIGEKEDVGYRVIDATNKWVIPGLVDLHVHLREPGFTHKEDIKSGCCAAARGGVTTMCCMPNTEPVVDNECIVEYIKIKAMRANGVNVIPIGAITKGQQGQTITDISKMKDAGICAISEDGKTVMNSSIMKQAMLCAAELDIPVFSHAEDMALIGGSMNEGDNAMLFGIKGIGREAEEIIIARDMILARHTGSKLHICHVSTRGGAELIEFAKSLGVQVTAETAPHYFVLDDTALSDFDANKKMNPPLRTKDDVEAIRDALKNGIIDNIATDHAPHQEEEKNVPIQHAPFGVIGLETSFAISYTYLVKTKFLSAIELVRKMSTIPASIINIDKGNIDVGKVADIAIIDVNQSYIIDNKDFVSKACNTPFNNMEVFGVVNYTLVNGKIIYENFNSSN
ncbi:MAG: dihydroorotase [Epulopiscium sp. Nuni2H_MBin003]|nr:MAG: dihydroorotase [Epulopiscium sp. Nuni2H_MBin003]